MKLHQSLQFDAFSEKDACFFGFLLSSSLIVFVQKANLGENARFLLFSPSGSVACLYTKGTRKRRGGRWGASFAGKSQAE